MSDKDASVGGGDQLKSFDLLIADNAATGAIVAQGEHISPFNFFGSTHSLGLLSRTAAGQRARRHPTRDRRPSASLTAE